MEYSEIVKLLSDPNKVEEGLLALDEYNKSLTGERDTLKAENAKNTDTINDLRNDKRQMWMRITGNTLSADEDDDKDAYETLVEKIKGENK